MSDCLFIHAIIRQQLRVTRANSNVAGGTQNLFMNAVVHGYVVDWFLEGLDEDLFDIEDDG